MAPADQSDPNIALRADDATRGVIDTTDGIGRIMGDRELYLRMLRRFRSDYGPGVAPIRAALAQADTNLAHRIAHTLKGASGMIGAQPLHEQASALERAIRTASGGEQDELDALEPRLQEVLRAIDILLSGSPADRAPPAPVRALPEDAELLAQLVDLLASGDGAAVDLLEESAASLTAILGVQRLHQVVAAANEFDFEGALNALRQGVGGDEGSTGGSEAADRV
jgi:HPt (histidine-containing phosphotransfer) domain-containing protein